MKFRLRVWHVLVGSFLLIVALVTGITYGKRSDCETICTTRHTRMVDTTYYGCLCDDGAVFTAPDRR